MYSRHKKNITILAKITFIFMDSLSMSSALLNNFVSVQMQLQ